MKNKIIFLAVVVLSFVAIGSFKKETTFSDNNIKEISDSICLEIMMNSDEEAFNVSGTITGNYANIQELYCNVTLLGKRYTYRIGLNDDDIYGKMYGATDRDLVKNMTFFGKLSNGEFVEIPYIAKWNIYLTGTTDQGYTSARATKIFCSKSWISI